MRDHSQSPHLQRISVAVPGFLFPKGASVPKGTLYIQPIQESDLVTQSISKGIPRIVFPSQHTTGTFVSSQPTNKEEGEGEVEKEKEIVDVSEWNSKDLYEVFDQPHFLWHQLVSTANRPPFNPTVSQELLFYQIRWGFKGSKSELFWIY